MAWITPYLPMLSIVLPFLGVILAVLVPIYLMRLNAKQLKVGIDKGLQDIKESKAKALGEQADAIDVLERVAKTTSEELEKSLQKSITMRNLLEQVGLLTTQTLQQDGIIKLQAKTIEEFKSQLAQQNDQIVQLTKDLALQKASKIELEDKIKGLHILLEAERDARQTALLQIDDLKSSSEEKIRKLTGRVDELEDYIRKNGLPIPESTQGFVGG